jgi:hypothetical protein
MKFQKKILNNFNKIKELNIQNNLSDKNLKTFAKHLNNSCNPFNKEDKDLYYYMKELYYSDKDQFIKFILNKEVNNYLILLTDNKTIMDFFNLNNIVYISWNNEYKKYYVNKYIKKEQNTSETLHSNDDNLYDVIENTDDIIISHGTSSC